MLLTLLLATTLNNAHATTQGYYRFPAISSDSIVFTAEGDLWKVPVAGGAATRLTAHPSQESHSVLSEDGQWVAFSASFEGPRDIYIMPIEGGKPERLSWGAEATARGFTPEGEVLYSSRRLSGLPDSQLFAVSLTTHETRRIPLAEADEGVWGADGSLYFTRMAFQGSSTKRYKGGTAQNLWRLTPDGDQAIQLDADFDGTSKAPMLFGNRIYYATDRDGTMNIWSMALDGTDKQQHTRHDGIDVQSPSIHGGLIAYQNGADIYTLDLATAQTALIEITIPSDLDQTRERWVTDPSGYLTNVDLSSDGSKVALTARGQVFVAPTDEGRIAQVTHKDGVRYRSAEFNPASDDLIVLSDESGELEFETIPANGMGSARQISSDGTIFRFNPVPSPDGDHVAYVDKDYCLWILDIKSGKSTQVVQSDGDTPANMSWSPDSKWLAYAAPSSNTLARIYLYKLSSKTNTPVTSERTHSHTPGWSTDGNWLYYLSDRTLRSIVGSPWGLWQPEPHIDKTTGIYTIPLKEGTRSPWVPKTEVELEDQPEESDESSDEDGDSDDDSSKVKVKIDLDDIIYRTQALPIPVGNYSKLTVSAEHLLWVETVKGFHPTRTLEGVAISSDDPEVKTITSDVDGYQLSDDGKKMLLSQSGYLYVFDNGLSAPDDLSEAWVNLSKWRLKVDPKVEWRQIFVEAWRLERDFFYDPGMHGTDWDAILQKYLPLVDRVTDRSELSDVISQMVGELSALHIFVRGGDFRDEGEDSIGVATLGAVLTWDEESGGVEITHIYQTDPDYPSSLSPLLDPLVDAQEGDIITHINGVKLLAPDDAAKELRSRANTPVRLTLDRGRKSHDTIATAISMGREADLRYREWQLSRRTTVEDQSDGEIGYVHLKAMGSANYTEWAQGFYPVFDRKGLIIDVRHNRGGNIDSWILEKLMRKTWFYWQGRTGAPATNMQYAFNGHVVVLIDGRTASDGEAFAEGVRRLGLGTVIGTRTWGGEIWLSFSNWLVDKGIASAAEWGVYGPEGEWLIEGVGVVPDIEVDNNPRSTFDGEDAQLQAAIEYLQKKIEEEPVIIPPPPPYPDKSH